MNPTLTPEGVRYAADHLEADLSSRIDYDAVLVRVERQEDPWLRLAIQLKLEGVTLATLVLDGIQGGDTVTLNQLRGSVGVKISAT